MVKHKKQGRSQTPSIDKKALKTGFSRNPQRFQWSLEYCYWEHLGWQQVSSLQYFAERIINKLKNLETQTWQEVQDASGGKSPGHGNNSHFINGSLLPKDEKEFFIKRGYMEAYGEVFSLRLSGLERLIGVADRAVFRIIWYDPGHEIFPSER